MKKNCSFVFCSMFLLFFHCIFSRCCQANNLISRSGTLSDLNTPIQNMASSEGNTPSSSPNSSTGESLIGFQPPSSNNPVSILFLKGQEPIFQQIKDVFIKLVIYGPSTPPLEFLIVDQIGLGVGLASDQGESNVLGEDKLWSHWFNCVHPFAASISTVFEILSQNSRNPCEDFSAMLQYYRSKVLNLSPQKRQDSLLDFLSSSCIEFQTRFWTSPEMNRPWSYKDPCLETTVIFHSKAQYCLYIFLLILKRYLYG